MNSGTFNLFKIFVLALILALPACSSSSDDDDDGGGGGETVTITGTVVDENGTPVAATTVKVKKGSDDEVLTTTTSGVDGTFSVSFARGVEVYVNMTKTGYAPSNTEMAVVDQDYTDTADNQLLIIAESTVGMLAGLIDGSADWSAAQANAWFALDIYMDNEDDVPGITVTAAPSTGITMGYNNCGGSYDMTAPTADPVCTDRAGPMLLGKLAGGSGDNVTFTASGTAVTGSENSAKLPLRAGEVTYADIWVD
jgi:hypothetical protein